MSTLSYRVEVWDLPHVSPWGRIHPGLQYSHLVCQMEKDDIGYGRVTFNGIDSDLINLIIDTDNDHGSVIRVFDDTDANIFTFFAETVDQVYSENGAHETVVHGQGIASILDKMLILPFDGLEGEDPNWQWGGRDQNLLRDGDFELEEFPNGGFESGNDNYWSTPEGGSITAVEDASGARTGDWYGLFNPGAANDVVRRSQAGLKIGELYVWSGYLKDITGTGDRWRIGVSGASRATNPNSYEVDGVFYVELGNATMGNGSSTGVYQLTSLTFEAAESSVEIFIEYMSANNHNAALDDWSVTGEEAEIGSWEIGTAIATMNVAEISSEQAHSGATSLKLQGSQPAYVDPFGRISYIAIRARQTPIGLTPGKVYTGEVWVYHTAGTSQRFTLFADRTSPKGPLSETVHQGLLPAPGSWWMASKTVTVAPNTWTLLQWTSIADTSSIGFGIAWNGGSTDTGVKSSPTFYVDDASLYEGLPATTIGDITLSLAGPIQDRGTGDWVDFSSITAALDANGDAWSNSEEGLDVSPGQTLLQFLDTCRDRGYEWGFDWNGSAYAFKMYNNGGLGVDRTVDPPGKLTFHPREGWAGTQAWRQSLPPYTAVFAEGDPGVYGYGEDTSMIAGYGRWEGSIYSSGVGVTEADTLTAWIAQELSRVEQQRFSAKVNMLARDGKRFGVDWGLGDKATFAFSNTPLGERQERIHSVQLLVTSDNEADISYNVDFVKAVLLEPLGGTTSAPTSYILNALLRKFRRRVEVKNGGITDFASSGGGGQLTVVVAASDASEISKSKADLVCTGTDDQDTINQAILMTVAGGRGGRVFLTEGQFNFTAANASIIQHNIPGLVIEGIGPESTLIVVTGSFGPGDAIFDCSSADNQIRQLRIEENTDDASRHYGIITGLRGRVDNVDGWVTGVDSVFVWVSEEICHVVDCNIEFGHIGVLVEDGYAHVQGCFINATGEAIVTSVADHIVIVNNTIFVPDGATTPGVISVGSGSRVVVSNNVLFGDTGTDLTGVNAFISIGANYTTVEGNTLQCNVTGPQLIVANIDGVVITGNNLAHGGTAGDDAGIVITAASYGSVVTGNLVYGGLFGIILDGDGAVMEGNLIDGPATEGIHIEGDSNLVVVNKVESDGTTDIGINIAAGSDNAVYANYLGDSSAYSIADLVDSGTNTQTSPTAGAIGGQFGVGGAPIGGASSNISNLSQAGTLSAGTGSFKLPFTLDAEIIAIKLAVGSAPTGSSIIVDVQKNGAPDNLFTTQANRPTIAAGSVVGAEAVPDVTSIAEGDYITVDIDQVGSTTPGTDLTVTIEWRPA